jgi:hypothetical protein
MMTFLLRSMPSNVRSVSEEETAMIVTLLAASIALQPIAQVGYAELASGEPFAAIEAIQSGTADANDPARLINLGIAHARNGDHAKARALFAQAYNAREWVELETASGKWEDSRSLARQALALLDKGEFARTGRLASK